MTNNIIEPWWVMCGFDDGRVLFVRDLFYWRAQQRAKWYEKADLDRHRLAPEHPNNNEDNCEVCMAYAIQNKQVLKTKHIPQETYRRFAALNKRYDTLDTQIQQLQQKIQVLEGGKDAQSAVTVRWIQHHSPTMLKFEIDILDETIEFEFMPTEDTAEAVVDEMLEDLAYIPKKYQPTLRTLLQQKLSDIQGQQPLQQQTSFMVLIQMPTGGKILWNLVCDEDVENIQDFKDLIGQEDIISCRDGVITVTKEGMLAYLLSEWSVMKRISNGDDDDKTTDVQVMWEKIPEDLRYDWLQDLTEAERLDFYLDATPQIQAAMSYMNLLSPAALKQSQRMSQWFSDDDENDGDDNAYATTAITTHNDWVSRLWSNNTTRQQQWQQQQDFSKYQQTKGLSDQQILDYALLQSLIESNPNLAQQQMEENHYPSADTAESMFDEANKDWQQQLALLPQQHNKNNVVVNDCTTIREL